MDDGFLNQSVAATGERLRAVAAAFVVLVRHSWPMPKLAQLFSAAERDPSPNSACQKLLRAFDAVHVEYPTAMFWWKDENSKWLGFCPRFAIAAGVPARELLGKTDADSGVVWTRQGALYMKDDREVLVEGRPRFDIIERQDRDFGTVWLRTSKVPYSSEAGAGTVGGFDTISAAMAQQIARRKTPSSGPTRD